MTSGWDAATFDGARELHARALARTTPDERFRWAMEALELAASTGALQRARTDKQAECDRLWRVEAAPRAGPDSGSPV